VLQHAYLLCGGSLAYWVLPVSCKTQWAKLGIAKAGLKNPKKCGGALTDLQPYFNLK